MNEFFSCFTRENITFVLSIIGSVGTVVSGMHALVSNRKKLSAIISEKNIGEDSIIVYISFINASTAPIIISDISIDICGKFFQCKKSPEVIVEYQKKDSKKGLIYHHEVFSLPIPIRLSGLDGNSGYFYFEIPRGVLEKHPKMATVLISTNRGNPLKIECPLSQ